MALHPSVNSISWYGNYIAYFISTSMGCVVLWLVRSLSWGHFSWQRYLHYAVSTALMWFCHLYLSTMWNTHLHFSHTQYLSLFSLLSLTPNIVRQQAFFCNVRGINMDINKVTISSHGQKTQLLLVPSALSRLWDLLSYRIHSFMLWLSQLHNKGFGWFSTEKHRTAAKRSTP